MKKISGRRNGLIVAVGLAVAGAPGGCRDTGTERVVGIRAALTATWTATDVGAVGAAGTWNETGGTHTVEGSGADIWNSADGFRFVYQSLAGDGTLTARVASLENTNAIAKAGVMMRESLAGGAKNVFALVTPTASNGFRFQSRATTDATTSRSFSGTGTPPAWVRLVRAGSTFSGFYSTDGNSWISIGPAVTVAMTSSILVGLAVTSHADGTLATAVFDSVSLTRPPPTFTSQDIGAVGAAGSSSLASGTHTIKGAGADIYGTADAFRFTYQTITGDVTVTARVASLQNTNVWAKAAVMIREDLTAGSRNVATLTSPTAANKFRLQVRSGAGGSTTSTASAASSAIPSWLRLERVGSTFRSFHSSDGAAWTQIGGAVTVAMNATVRVGLAVTSHLAGTLATATFTNVSITPSPPLAPAGLTATPGNKQVHLSWSAAAGALGYAVGRSNSPGGPYGLVQSGITSTIFTNTGLSNGSTYYFVVTASNAAGESPLSAEVSGAPLLLRPSVRSISPADGSTGVATTAFVSGDLIMPNVGGGVDASTMTSATVFLSRASDSALVPATLNTSGGGDVVVLQPSTPLDPQTLYGFTITSGLLDLTGAPFIPFNSSFTTGDPAPPPPPNIAFDKVALPTVTLRDFTSITIGPDNRVYAATLTGELVRWPINADGTLGGETVINTIISNNGGARAVIGLTFDPAATSSNLILWVTHGGSALKEAPDWSGKLSKLTGATLGTYQDVVVNFPRSFKDHMTNSIAFKAGQPGILYINQGSMNAMGAPDNAWGQRAEHLLSATVLRLDTSKLGALPLDAMTNDADPTASGYNPFAANAPLTIFASGVRNAYDLVWHSNGELYVPTNGSAAGGNSPATPSPLPSACSRRIDGTPYTGPAVPGITSNPIAEDDFLFRVVQGGSYGHPNPSRCEWVLNGGNPTSAVDPGEVAAYPQGTLPDRNWRGAAYTFGAHYSPNGVIEWRSNVFSSMQGNLLVVRFSGGDDIIVLTIDPTTKNVSSALAGITGLSGFSDPLDLVANSATGDIYLTEHAARKITLLRPHP